MSIELNRKKREQLKDILFFLFIYLYQTTEVHIYILWQTDKKISKEQNKEQNN